MLDPTQFKPNGDAEADEWFGSVEGRDVEVLIRGTRGGLDSQALSRASEVVNHLDRLTERAIALLREFIKDQGAWTLVGVGCGAEADRQRCDFLLSFTFEAESDPWRDTYVYYDVGFVVHERGVPNDRQGRPIKFVVGFH